MFIDLIPGKNGNVGISRRGGSRLSDIYYLVRASKWLIQNFQIPNFGWVMIYGYIYTRNLDFYTWKKWILGILRMVGSRLGDIYYFSQSTRWPIQNFLILIFGKFVYMDIYLWNFVYIYINKIYVKAKLLLLRIGD